MGLRFRRGKFFVSAAVTCAALAGCSTTASDEVGEKWTNARHQAFSEFRDNKYDQSIEEYLKAVKIAERFGPHDLRLASTLSDMARVYAAKGDYKSAEVAYRRCLFVASTNASGGDTEPSEERVARLTDAYRGIANAEQKLGHSVDADRCYQLALAAASTSKDPSNKRDVLYEYHSFLDSQGRRKETQILERKKGELAVEQPLPDRNGRLLESFKSAMKNSEEAFQQNDISSAIRCNAMALKVANQLPDRKVMADAATRLGNLFSHEGNYAQAEKAYGMALANYDKCSASEKERYQCLYGYTRALKENGKVDQAEVYAKRSLVLAASFPTAGNAQQLDLLGILASICVTQKRFDDALIYQTRAYNLARKNTKLTDPTVVMQVCYATYCYYACYRPDQAKRFIQTYTREVLSKRGADASLPSRLLIDFGSACLRQHHAAEASLFFTSALDLMKNDAGQKAEVARAKDQLNAARAEIAGPRSNAH